MKYFLVLAILSLVITGCVNSATPKPAATPPPTSTQTAIPSPTLTPTLIPTETPAAPILHEGYPKTTADFTDTGLTDAQFTDKWKSSYKAYYLQEAQLALADATPASVTPASVEGSVVALVINSKDGIAVNILASFITHGTDQNGEQIDIYYLVVAFKGPDGIRVIRGRVGTSIPVTTHTRIDNFKAFSDIDFIDLATSKGKITDAVLVLSVVGFKNLIPQTIAFLNSEQDQVSPLSKVIIDSKGKQIPEAIDDLEILIYFVSN
jgi:hypothetical protein